MRRYETLYIIKPDLADEEYTEVVRKFSDLIEKEKGVVIKLDEWGKQKLAYLVKNSDQGAYVLMDYCGGPGITAGIERGLKLDDRVLKFRTLKLAEEVDPQALIGEEKRPIKEIPLAEGHTPEEEAVRMAKTESVQGVKNGV